MKTLSIIATAIGLLLGSAQAHAEETKPEAAPGKVKYRAGKDVSFEELLIQGELKRPEITVVTGNAQQGTDGLLRLREDFLDRIAVDFGEKVATEKSK